MKQSVFNLNTLKAHPERNAFDLSHNDVFSCAPGMLLPVSCTEVLPNEHYEINPQIFLRTMPLNSAAFVRMRQHVEFFFVPMRVLCRQFNQFVVGTKYPQSALSTLNEFSGSLPAVPLNHLRALVQLATGADGLGIALSSGIRRLLDLLGYGFSTVRDVNDKNYPDNYATSNPSITQEPPKLSLFRLCAYQKIYQDFYRNPYWESPDVSSFNLDDKFGDVLLHDPNAERLRSICCMRYRNWTKDFFTSVQPTFQGAPFVTRTVDMSNFILDTSGANVFSPSTVISGTKSSIPNSESSSVSSLSASYSQGGRLAIPIHNIRAAFALDKLYRLQQQSGNGSYGEQRKKDNKYSKILG